MTVYRVSILCLDEGERAMARALLWGTLTLEVNGDYLIGIADEAGFDKLTAAGLLVNAEVAGTSTDWVEPIASETADTVVLNDALLGGEGGRSDRCIVDLAGPLTSAIERRLRDAGATIERRLGGSRYVLRYAGANLTAISDIPSIDTVRWYDVKATLGDAFSSTVARTLLDNINALAARTYGIDFQKIIPPDFLSELSRIEWGGAMGDTSGGDDAPRDHAPGASPDVAAAVEEVPYDIRCHNPTDVKSVAAAVGALEGVLRIEIGHSRIRYWTARNPTSEAILVTKTAALAGAAIVEPYVAPEPLLDWARASLWGAPGPGPTGPWQGEGQIVAITDSGIDEGHPDFTGRFEAIYHAASTSTQDPLGHGTHVASIVAGDGAASNGVLVGVAPKARLFIQCVADANGQFTGLGVGVRKLMQEAFDKGARIQNFSWGARVDGRYVLDALELDEFVAENPDHLVVVAAGNWGIQDESDPNRPIALSSLGAPANAKNCLTVGACCSPRTDGPYAGLSWAHYDGAAPPQHPPMAALPLTGDAGIVASLSSRGPSDEGRIKPDLVAVGVGVAAARSHGRGGPLKPWEVKPDHYMYLTGTSMAAPMVSGAAAVLRGYFIELRKHQPTAALLKATLINGARWIVGPVQEDKAIGEPNFHQGFGRLDLSCTFPADESAKFALTFVDVRDGDPEALRMGPSTAAVSWRRRLVVSRSDFPLSITMCWTDPPSRGLQHELDLVVIAPDGTKFVGNAALVRLPRQKTDRINNVEKVTIENPAVGEWSAMVTAFNTFRHAQGFAVAATGAISDWIA